VSGLLYTALYAIPLVARRLVGLRDRPVKDALPAPTDLNWLVAFWWAYIMTRPLGASYACSACRQASEA
jgi:hypothetical protein